MDTEKNIDDFLAHYSTVNYKKGTLILQPGDIISSIFYVRKGFIRMYTILPDGKELTVNIFQTGSYFPIFLVFASAENSYFFEPLISSECIQIPKKEMFQYITNNVDLLRDFTTRLSIGFQGLLETIPNQFSGSVHDKIASTLTMLAKRFGKKTAKGIELDIPLSHQDIANLTGIARETASIELEKLSRSKIITYTYKHLTILDLPALGDDL